jgi:hypothetical protein
MVVPCWIALNCLSYGCGDDAAVGDDGPPYDLNIIGHGLTPGGEFHAHLQQSDGVVLFTDQAVLVDSDALDITYTGILAADVIYDLSFYLDRNHSGRCDAPPSDLAWNTTVGPIGTNLTVDLGTLAQDPTACASFPTP